MQCPHCQSPNVQRRSVAYEQGTVRTTTSTSGTAYSRGTDMGTGAAFSGQHDISATHSSTQRSAFAARAAPPGNPVIRPFMLLGVLVGFLVVITLINRVFPQIFVFLLGTAGWSGPGFRGLEHLTWLAIALAVVWLIYGFTRLPAHRAAVEHWRKTWVCLACGGTFVPDA